MSASASFKCILRAWEAHERELLAFLLHRTGNQHQAEDLLQEIFLKSIRQGQNFCSLANPRAWLFQVTRNALIDAARTSKSFEALPEELAAPTGEKRSPVDDLDTCIERNLSVLPADDRHIIETCDLQGQTVRAYAAANGLTLAAAKSRLLRARKRLRDTLVVNCQVRFDEAGQVCCHTPRPPT